jgi:hypothetical protein
MSTEVKRMKVTSIVEVASGKRRQPYLAPSP